MPNMTKCYYNPSKKPERYRLRIQADRVLDEDIAVIQRALHYSPRQGNLIALDAGCADGYVTGSRFSPFSSSFKLILGVDKNEDMVKRASERFYADPRFLFRCCDLDRCSNPAGLIPEGAGAGFDLIYCANILHQLTAPLNILAQLGTTLRAGGVLVYKGVDDGTKICFPYSEHLQRILTLTIDPRLHASDRYFSRKLPGLAKQAGYTEIFSVHKGIDTFGMNLRQRQDLFRESFYYRLLVTQDALNRRIKNAKLIHKKMELLLSEFENYFLSDNFYYLEHTIWFVFKK